MTFRLIASYIFAVLSCSQFCFGQQQWKAAAVVAEREVQRLGVDKFFSSEEIDDSVYAVMQGHSMPADCPVKRSELRYLRILHRNFDGGSQTGEIVCNKAIAADLLYIFRRLYDEGYPIERVTLIDNFGADDEASMTANNTSCFCYRSVRGSNTISFHGRGLAIDINPLYNPCVRTRNGVTTVEPAAGRKYISRTKTGKEAKYIITRQSIIYRLFTERGFKWGGNWRTLKDYQHFEKAL